MLKRDRAVCRKERVFKEREINGDVVNEGGSSLSCSVCETSLRDQ